MGQACDTGQLGVCATGTKQCSNGALQCVRTTAPTAEICTGGLDEDCDGLTDAADPDCVIGLPGDINGDGVVNRADVNIITANRNKPASACPTCDIDGDGMITVLDARKDVLLCTNPLCN